MIFTADAKMEKPVLPVKRTGFPMCIKLAIVSGCVDCISLMNAEHNARRNLHDFQDTGFKAEVHGIKSEYQEKCCITDSHSSDSAVSLIHAVRRRYRFQ